MKGGKLNLMRSAGYGAVWGVPFLLSHAYFLGPAPPKEISKLIGFVLGGALGGAIVFALIASICNLFIRKPK